jgi:HEAT repeat protein
VGLLGTGKPNVKSLAHEGDIAGLINAVFYPDPRPEEVRGDTDLGAQVRADAVAALAAAGPEQAGLAVIDALRDSSDFVRTTAVRVLHGWREASPLAEAVKWLPMNGGRARQLALLAVAELAQPGTALELGHALIHADQDEPLRMNEARLIVELVKIDTEPDAVEDVVEVAVAALGNEREAVAQRAEQLLAELAPASARRVQAALLGEPAVPRAASVLARIGDLSALDPLVGALEHPNPDVRSHSCAALGELRSPAAVEPLLGALNDSDPDVRASAGAALNGMGTVAVIFGISALVRQVPSKARAPSRSRKGAAGKPSRARRTPEDTAKRQPVERAGPKLTSLSNDLQHARREPA